MTFEEAVEEFHKLYNSVREKYGLRIHTLFSIYGEGLIEIYEYVGNNRGRCVVKVNEQNETDCYERAKSALEMYVKAKENRK